MAQAQTPMMKQYRRIKSEVPSDAFLLFRLGDFYEMFFEDAKEASAIANLTLTKRNGIPMCGVPYHAAEGYIAKLIQAGRRVAVCEQITEPKPGQMVERAVSHILSPGSVLNLELTQPKENRFVAAHVEGKTREGVRYGFAFLDMSTGEFRLTEMDREKAWQDEILRLQPKELVIPAQSETPEIPDILSVVKTEYDEWVFDHEQAELTLLEHFKVKSLEGYGCAEMTLGVAAAGALLHYVTTGLKGSAAHILNVRPYSTADYLVLDAITQRNLELVSSMATSASDTSLLKAMDQTVTAMGGRELRKWILHPLCDVQLIKNRQEMVGAWLKDVGRLDGFRDRLKEVRDLERLISRLAQGSGNARDLQALRQSLSPLGDLKKFAEKCGVTLGKALAQEIVPQNKLEALIEKAIEEEPPVSLKDGQLIRQGFHPEIDELKSAARSGKEWLAKFQAQEQERTGIKSLKVRFNQVFGYYIEVTKSNLDQVPETYTRKQTLVNAERFITPELKEIEGKILGAEDRLKKLEYEVFLEVRDEVVRKTAEIQQTAQAIARLDVLAGLAVLARLYDYACPEVMLTGKLHIVEGRHPVLEQVSGSERFVPNDTHLNNDDRRLVILTGPNMAGKSTYIRQVALISLMAHIGSYVPAQSAYVPVMDRIFTRVGASDDLSRGQSTFMVEMNETANILNNATDKSLVILDEIGRGTSTFDGLSIAWSVAEFLHDKVKSRTLFATHYHELTELAILKDGVKNYNVAVREWHDEIIFIRKIVEGGTDKSYGIQVARLAGLPKGVIDRSKEILRNLEENALDAHGKPHVIAARKDDPAPVKKRRAKKKIAKKATKKKASKKKVKVKPPQLDLFKQPSPPAEPSEEKRA